MKIKIEKLLASKLFPFIYGGLIFAYCIIRNIEMLAGNKQIIGGDALSSYYAIEFLRECFLNGEVPFWNKYLANGTPFMGVSYSIFNFYNILCLLFHSEMVYFLEYILCVTFGGIFFYLYLNEIKCKKEVSLVFSIIYLLSVHMGGSRVTHLVIIITITCFPILLYIIEKYMKSGKTYLLLLLAVIMAIQFHNGFMQICLYSDIAVFVYFVIRYMQTFSEKKKIFLQCFKWVGTYLLLIIGFAVPTFYLLLQYAGKNSDGASFTYFITGSIHPIKLLMMFIPDLWDNVFTPLAEYSKGTSGMDIELFLGTLISVICLTGIFKYIRKVPEITVSFFFAFIAFAYASCAAFLPLAEILFKIPLLNMFRMPSRVLFIFIFFVLVIAALTLSRIIQEENYRPLYYGCTFYIVAWLGLCIIEKLTALVYLENILAKGKYIAVSIFLFEVILWFLQKLLYEKNKSIIKAFICLFVLMYTIVQTKDYNQVDEKDTSMYLLPVESVMAEDIGNQKIMQLSTNDISYVHSIANYNRALFSKLPAINSELAFNNPALLELLSPQNKGSALLNQTNALAFFKDSLFNVSMQNDLLSMLGIKYVVDSEDLMDELQILDRENGDIELKIDEVQVNVKEPMVAHAEIVELQKNRNYRVTFDYECENWDSSIYLDFFGENYDYPEQDMILYLKSGKGKYDIIVNSGEIPDDILCYFRVISNGTTEMVFKNIEIKECKMKENSVYEKVSAGDGFYGSKAVVYENKNAQDVLYVPQEVLKADDISIVYNYYDRKPLNEVSYVQNMESFKPGRTEIKDICWENNGITATVTAESQTFVNFSQNMSSDWIAYVDGQKVTDMKVNDLIQGIVVPEGTHVICFEYRPTVVISSNITNLIFFMMAIGSIIWLAAREKRRL